MAINADALGSLIRSNMNANGKNAGKFANEIAAGIAMSIIGQSFKTIDIGAVPGVGAGTGVGITGMDSDAMTQKTLTVMKSQLKDQTRPLGSNAKRTADAIMQATVQHLGSSAMLTSVDTPVFAGAGQIVVGSITVSESEMAQNIYNSISGKGNHRMDYATAIAAGVTLGVMMATGTLQIAGSPASTPSPGSGSGQGVVS
jgi:hypothetical protein